MADLSLNSTSVAYESSRIVKNTPGVFFGCTGYNSKGTAQFIQVHDATVAPPEGAVPVITFPAQAASGFSLDFGLKGRTFTKGIVLVNSSTGPTKTIGSADCWFDAQYI